MLYVGYDVPTCESRVPFVYVGACLLTVHICDVLVMFCMEVRMVWLILISIRTFGGWDWPGVSTMAYLYVFDVCFIFRRLVSIVD